MKNQTNNRSRRQEIIDICLNQFIENGLYNTSARDLANALEMQPSGLYYYFKSKDDIVVACAEEAGIMLEDVLLMPVFDCLDNTGQYVTVLEDKMKETIPVMKFFAQACTTKEYRSAMQPVMERLKTRHEEYSVKLAKRLCCQPEEVAPYLYACVAIVSNFMIFGEDFYYKKPFQLIANAIQDLKKRSEILENAPKTS